MAEFPLPDDGAACKTCRFLGPKMVRNKTLFPCRRFPPAVQAVVEKRTFEKDHYKGIATWSENISDVTFWPMVVLDEWCGEYVEAAK